MPKRTANQDYRLNEDVRILDGMIRYAVRYGITKADADYARGLLEAILSETKSKTAKPIFD